MRLMLTLLAVIYSAAFSHSQRPPPCPYSLPSPSPPHNHLSWQEFKVKFGKQYASLAEEHYGSQVFARAVRKMHMHNSNPARKYDMRINPLFEVENDEFQEVYTRAYSSPSKDRHSQGRARNRERRSGERKDNEMVKKGKN